MGGVRYFEKDNGGVSTALNLGIKNMRGQYFSWLSHDDIYLPEKVQIEIDALRKAGDMSRVVYGITNRLFMPSKKTTKRLDPAIYRQGFLETGAFLPLFGLVHGCSLLIPKFYFEAYGGFEETFRAIQDYKKFFELFRGKRLIFVHELLNFCRRHQETTSNTYDLVAVENDWLHSWMYQNLTEYDLVGSGLTDLYNLYSALFTFWLNAQDKGYTVKFLTNKIAELPESPDADARAKQLSNLINGGDVETYLPSEQATIIKFDFNLHGVNLGGNVKFIPFNQFANVKPAKNVRLLTRDSLMQVLIDTPIRKQLFEQWLQQQVGRLA